MNIVEAIIDDMKPSHAKPGGIWVGMHWTAVKSRFVGMAHTYKTGENPSIGNGGALSNLSLDELVGLALSENTLEASVGCAAINSMIKPMGKPGNVSHVLKRLARGKRVSIIGRFPFNDEIRRIASECFVLEMVPAENEYPSSAAEDILPRCSLNIITAATLINHTLDGLLEFGNSGVNIVLGPSTPFSDVLFERGVEILAGVEVVDDCRLVETIIQGAKRFSEIGGIRPLYTERQ